MIKYKFNDSIINLCKVYVSFLDKNNWPEYEAYMVDKIHALQVYKSGKINFAILSNVITKEWMSIGH